jgi:hypothetical protein
MFPCKRREFLLQRCFLKVELVNLSIANTLASNSWDILINSRFTPEQIIADAG